MIYAPYFLASIVLLVAGVLVWRRRNHPGLTALAWMMFGLSLASLVSGLELLLPRQALTLLPLEIIGWNVASVASLVFAWRYPSPLRRVPIWLIAVIFAPAFFFGGLAVSNGLHRLLYIQVVILPGEPPINAYEATPLTWLLGLYTGAVILAAAGIMGWKGLYHRRKVEGYPLLLACSLLLPMLSYSVYTLLAFTPAAEVLLAFSFGVEGLLVTLIVFAGQEQMLHRTVIALQSEIERRSHTEAELRQAETKLSGRLAAQTWRLSGLYDVILLGSQPSAPEDPTQTAIETVAVVNGMGHIALYQLDSDVLRCIAVADHDNVPSPLPASLPSGWLPAGQETLAAAKPTPALPEALHARTPLLARSLALPDEQEGALLGCWLPGRAISVEDIALFDATADLLTVILENATLRRQAAAAALRDERARMARELHDSVAQSLHSLTLSAATAQQLAAQGRATDLNMVLDHLALAARQALKEIRLLLYGLRVDSVGDLGLADALQTRLDAVERRAGVTAVLTVDASSPWPDRWDHDLYGIATEALNNALKHARAGFVAVTLHSSSQLLSLSIVDDGRGFHCEDADHAGMGLTSMAERAARLDGKLAIHSTVGAGTQVEVIIPQPAHAAAPALTPQRI